jgi:hypothetical protein
MPLYNSEDKLRMKCKTAFVYKGLALLCSLLLLSACATTAPKAASIQERANARWEALLTGDLATAYEYLTPGIRSSVSSIQYQRSILIQPVRWTSADYIDSVCEEMTCKVTISIGFTVYGAVPGVKSFKNTKKVEESWVLVDDQWYFSPNK